MKDVMRLKFGVARAVYVILAHGANSREAGWLDIHDLKAAMQWLLED